jgi:hypothetical protein
MVRWGPGTYTTTTYATTIITTAAATTLPLLTYTTTTITTTTITAMRIKGTVPPVWGGLEVAWNNKQKFRESSGLTFSVAPLIS